MTRLQPHRWPGNIRELENLLRRLVAIDIDDTITIQAVERELASTPSQVKLDVSWISTGSLPEFMENYLSRYFAGFGKACRPPASMSVFWRRWSQPCCAPRLLPPRAISSARRNCLGINRNTLRVKLRDRNVKVIRGL